MGYEGRYGTGYEEGGNSFIEVSVENILSLRRMRLLRPSYQLVCPLSSPFICRVLPVEVHAKAAEDEPRDFRRSECGRRRWMMGDEKGEVQRPAKGRPFPGLTTRPAAPPTRPSRPRRRRARPAP